MSIKFSARDRIRILPIIAAAAVAPTFSIRSLAAQSSDATAAAGGTFDDLGLPVLDLVFTADALTGMPEEVEAGRYLVRVSGEAKKEDFALGAMFIGLPEGLSAEDAHTQAMEATDAPPAFIYESTIPGGRAFLPVLGETSAESVVDLTAGNWMIMGAGLSRPPMPFVVTGDVAADVPVPVTNVSLEMGEMYFEVVDGSFIAGENVISLHNAGVQPHFTEIMGVPAGTTNEMVEAAIHAEMTGTPTADALDMSQVSPAGYLGDQSTGTTSWSTLTLEPGTYALMCWIGDPETGMPHAMMGMHAVVEVS